MASVSGTRFRYRGARGTGTTVVTLAAGTPGSLRLSIQARGLDLAGADTDPVVISLDRRPGRGHRDSRGIAHHARRIAALTPAPATAGRRSNCRGGRVGSNFPSCNSPRNWAMLIARTTR